MKKFLGLILVIISLLISGCSATLRNVKGEKIERNSDEIQVKVISTTQLQAQGVVFREAGINVEIKNISNSMIVINLNNSSLSLDGLNGEYSSRIISGNDRIKNVNSVVPNIVLAPNATRKIVLYPADLLQPVYHFQDITGFEVIPQFKNFDKIRLSLAYHSEIENSLNLEKTKYFLAIYQL